jgi:MFS family permease
LVCEDSLLVVRAKCLVLLIAGVLTMFVASLSDVIGRKVCFILSLVAIISGTMIGVIYDDIYILTVALCFTMLGKSYNFGGIITALYKLLKKKININIRGGLFFLRALRFCK